MLRRMHKAEVADHVDNPEILVARGCLHDLFGRGQFNQGCVFDLGADGNDVLRVILHRACGLLAEGSDGRNGENNSDDEF